MGGGGLRVGVKRSVRPTTHTHIRCSLHLHTAAAAATFRATGNISSILENVWRWQRRRRRRHSMCVGLCAPDSGRRQRRRRPRRLSRRARRTTRVRQTPLPLRPGPPRNRSRSPPLRRIGSKNRVSSRTHERDTHAYCSDR